MSSAVAGDARTAFFVAVVDDDAFFRDYVCRLLEVAGVRTFPAESGAGLIALLEAQEIDCVLLDYNLGAENGIVINEQLRGRLADPPPVVMLTGEGRDTTIVKAFRSGVSDFLSKRDLTSAEMLRAIRDAVETKTEERIQRDEIVRLKRETSRDHMTGLYTREFMDARLEAVHASAQACRGAYAVILVDMVGTRTVNERLGHVAGDRAIKEMAAQLLKSSRSSDVCARYEGDRLICLLDSGNLDCDALTAICQSLSTALTFQLRFDRTNITLGSALGAAIYPVHGVNVAQVLRTAEEALAAAKALKSSFRVAEVEGAPRTASSTLAAPLSRPGPTEARPEERGGDESAGEENRRRAPRHRVLMRGLIVTSSLLSTTECTIRNLSSTGAGLRMNGLSSPPDEFELDFLRTGERRRARVVWQNGPDIGVEFC
jgi:two-component system cell cycle response regulator